MRVSTRLGLLLGLSVVLAHVRLSGRPSTLCLLRATTGIPCPLCGGTTAAVEIGSGDLVGALRASPLAVAGAPVVAALPALRGHLERVPPRVRLAGLLVALAAAEVWQLVRFGLL